MNANRHTRKSLLLKRTVCVQSLAKAHHSVPEVLSVKVCDGFIEIQYVTIVIQSLIVPCRGKSGG